MSIWKYCYLFIYLHFYLIINKLIINSLISDFWGFLQGHSPIWNLHNIPQDPHCPKKNLEVKLGLVGWLVSRPVY